MYTVLRIVELLFQFYSLLILVYCIMSWIPLRQEGLLYDIASALHMVVAPFINVFRRLVPPLAGIDFSPVLAVIALNLIEWYVMRLLLMFT